MERSFALNNDLFETRIYSIDYSNAAKVSTIENCTSQIIPVTKRLLYRGTHQNMEGLGLGPAISYQANLLLGIVDNGDPLSNNNVVSFVVRDITGSIADFDNSGCVDVHDLRSLIDAWGISNWIGCREDINENGLVEADDLIEWILNWGACS